MIRYGYGYGVNLGALLNPFDSLAPTDLTTTAVSDVQINLAWTVNSVNATGHRIYISTDNITFTEHSTVALPVNSANITGLSNYTRYYFKVVAYSGPTESTAATADAYTIYAATLATTGDGTGVSTFAIKVSATITLTMQGAARFYTNSGGTDNEATTWSPTAGAIRTIYLKLTAGTDKIFISDPTKITDWGDTSVVNGYSGNANSPTISMFITPFPLRVLFIRGNVILSGDYGNLITKIFIESSFITEDHSTTLMRPALAQVTLNGANLNFTSLDFSGSNNITTLALVNWRTAKLTSAEMITLLTSLTNRVGTLPATITINDYADYASPPAEVVTAVNALKAAKSITTVNLGA